MQGEVLLLHRKRQGKSLLMSWRVQQEEKCLQGCKANGKIQAGCSESKDISGKLDMVEKV